MATKKSNEEQILLAAQEMRDAHHAERGNENPKDWNDLPVEKQQRWLDKVTGQDD